ncbi:MAG: hypothetical protein CVU18_04405 [Betaproteobacteria bacterium HGW-Betaproteobacteria-12]|nr:MAG: hypothetical protein CVU18_04405 [Betaproteobacteria bacterium HGW-Betaproteobacteria-12]
MLANQHIATDSAELFPAEPPSEAVITARWDKAKGCLVSVSMLTYNHAKYLRQAFDGILNQVTNFGFEILVHDDASSDDSQAIIKEYHGRYPNIVKPIYQTENKYSQGIYPSVEFNYPRCNAAFIAICEGDDCWTDPAKLQIQIDALTAHPDVDLAFHQATKIDYSAPGLPQTRIGHYAETDRIVSFIEVLHRRNGPLPTASCVIRQRAFQDFFSFIRGRGYLTIGDLYLQFFGSIRGGAVYSARPMSIYRVNTTHSWSRSIIVDAAKKAAHEVAMIRSYCELDKITQGTFTDEFRKLIVQRVFWLFDGGRTSASLVERLGLHDLYDIYEALQDINAIQGNAGAAIGRNKYVIYGAGSGCGLLMRKMTSEDVVAIIDLYGGKVGQTMYGVPVDSVDNLSKYHTYPVIVSTFAHDTSSFDNLIAEYGFDPSQIIYFWRGMVALIDIDRMLPITERSLSLYNQQKMAPEQIPVQLTPSASTNNEPRKAQPMQTVWTMAWSELPPVTYSDSPERHAYAPVVPKANYSPWRTDAPFLEAFSIIQGLTLVDIYRCFELWSLLRQCVARDGEIIEIGVWRGGTSALLAKCRDLHSPGKKLFLCDTFSGVVKSSTRDRHYRGGEHANTHIDILKGALQMVGAPDATILEGIFPDDSAHLLPQGTKFCFAHIDVDTYQSAKDCFEYIWPRLTPGGAVVFDDYGFQYCGGVTTLCNELASGEDRVFIHNLNGHGILLKLA